MELNKLEKIKALIRPYLKRPIYRTDHDIHLICQQLSDIKFFQSISEGKNYETILNDLAKSLIVEVYEAGECIVNYGEVGDKFYLILYGTVSVLVPTISSNSRPGSRADIRASIIQRPVAKENKSKIQNKLEKNEIESLKFFIESGLVINRKDSMKLDLKYLSKLGVINEMKEVAIMKPGDSFGELALISEKPRAASIEANEITVLAVLSKSQFKKVLSQEAERTLKQKVSFLENLPVFKEYTKSSVSKLSYYFTELKFKKGDVVYTEGSAASFIYFVVNGEFRLSQNVVMGKKRVIEIPSGFVRGREYMLKKNRSREVSQEYQVQFSTKGKSEIIGHEEFVNGTEKFTQTCICFSSTGLLYAIKHEDFRTRLNLNDSMKFLSVRKRRDDELHRSLENAGKIVENFSRYSSRSNISCKSVVPEISENKAKKLQTAKLSFDFKPRSSSQSINQRVCSSVNFENYLSPKRPVLRRKKSSAERKKENSRLRRLPPPNFMKTSRAVYSSMNGNKRTFWLDKVHI